MLGRHSTTTLGICKVFTLDTIWKSPGTCHKWLCNGCDSHKKNIFVFPCVSQTHLLTSSFSKVWRTFKLSLVKVEKKLKCFDDNFRTRPFYRLVKMGAPFYHKHALLVCKEFCALIFFYFCIIHPFFHKVFWISLLQTSFFAPLQCPFLTLKLFHNTFIFISSCCFCDFFCFLLSKQTHKLYKSPCKGLEKHTFLVIHSILVYNFHSKKQTGQW